MPHSSSPPLWTLLPFAGILLCIALLPLFLTHFWEKNRNKGVVVLVWSLPILFYFHSDLSSLVHTLKDYFSFISLIGSLFIISGGIAITGDLRGKPSTNLGFLGLGAILANIIGTTGASMLLIRPFLKTNRERKNTWHLPLFFIFIVSNVGGLLTPLGDPPLFLGYLNGVPFHWTFSLFPEWFTAVTILLTVFYGWDYWAYRREGPGALKLDEQRVEPLRLKGTRNFILLAGIVGAVFLPSPWREIIMIALAVLSYRLTPQSIHKLNQFSFFPIIEVAILFIGIFITMTPPLQILEIRGGELGLTKPWQFFWTSGALSSFLDNAPTYLTFFNLAKGLHVEGGIAGVPEVLLKAISTGAVFMGANSYIGNGPNFMVKAIADEQGFKTLNFGAYLLMAMVILVPIYLLFTWIFF
jgi:Na+/H+ antiporter NhaD/arsenite permease-like protein